MGGRWPGIQAVHMGFNRSSSTPSHPAAPHTDLIKGGCWYLKRPGLAGTDRGSLKVSRASEVLGVDCWAAMAVTLLRLLGVQLVAWAPTLSSISMRGLRWEKTLVNLRARGCCSEVPRSPALGNGPGLCDHNLIYSSPGFSEVRISIFILQMREVRFRRPWATQGKVTKHIGSRWNHGAVTVNHCAPLTAGSWSAVPARKLLSVGGY